VARVYSTYEAKAKLSEILRKVRTGQSVGISYRGQLVAEVRPVEPPHENLEERIRRLESQGVLTPPGRPNRGIARVAKRPGALKRFLASRE
jgi:prevent-host-death family protein